MIINENIFSRSLLMLCTIVSLKNVYAVKKGSVKVEKQFKEVPLLDPICFENTT